MRRSKKLVRCIMRIERPSQRREEVKGIGMWLSALLLGAIIFLPGLAWVRLVWPRTTTLQQLALAPALTACLILFASLTFSHLGPLATGIAYTTTNVLTTLAAVTALAVIGLIVRYVRTRGRAGENDHSQAAHWSLILALALGWILAALPFVVVVRSSLPLQQWDPTFHLSAVKLVMDTHDANPLGSLGLLYGQSVGPYYPSTWHAWAVLGMNQPTAVVNASSLVLLACWIIGVAAFTQAVTHTPDLTKLASIIAGLTLAFPADFISAYAQWPNAMSMALTPALLAGILTWGQQYVSQRSWPRLLAAAVVLAGACLGAFGSHPITAFNLVLLLAAPCFALAWHGLRGHLDYFPRWLAAICLLIMGAGITIAYVSPLTRALGNFVRRSSWIDAIAHVIAPQPPFPLRPLFVLAIAAFVLATGVGLWHTWRRPQLRWLVATWIVTTVAIFLAYAPDFGLRFLVGPWYSDARRLMGAAQVVTVVIMSVGLYQVCQRRFRSRALLAAGIIAVLGTGIGALDSRIAAMRAVYDPNALGPAGMVTAAQLDLIEHASQLLPPGSVVLGDPSIGTPYFYSIGERGAIPLQLTKADRRTEAQELLTNFATSRHSDLQGTCQRLQRLRITHLYVAPDSKYYQKTRSSMYPGLYDPALLNPTAIDGLVEVASADGAKLYRIDFCSAVK